MSDVLKTANFKFDAPKDGECDVLVIAGEHSGDEQSARMLRAVFRENPNLKVCAFGGAELKSAGAQLLFDMTSFSVVGLAEVLKNYSFFKRLSEAVVSWIDLYRPKTVCFVDYPGFNLHIADILRKRSISKKGGGSVKMLFYISPQIWAWKSARRFKMAKNLDSLAVIFPFETDCYSDTPLKASFVGHPFLSEKYVSPVHYSPDGEILLLAGSRKIAVGRIFPVMVKALALLPKERAVAIYPTPEIKSVLERVLGQNPDVAGRVRLSPNCGDGIAAKAMMASSGTMSLACSLEGIPGAIVYKANALTYIIGRSLVKIKYLSIANILLDKPAWREFIQFEASPKKLADYMKRDVLCANARKKFADYADKLKSILHAPQKTSAAQWLLKNICQ